MSASAAAVAFERDAGARLERIGDAARARLAERRRPASRRMRALSAAPGGRIAWRSIPAPAAPGPRGAIVHPIAVATCDLDRALLLGRTPFPMPLHPGHECVAEVVEVGSEVERTTVGARVVVPFQINCGECAPCRAGLTGNCRGVPPLSMYGFGFGGGHWGGVIADLVAVPCADAMLVELPQGVEPAAAVSAADNVCDAHRHVAPHLPGILEREGGADVVILAAQSRGSVFSPSLPLYSGQMALAFGAGRVFLADARPPVRAHAESLGITAIEPAALRGLDPVPLVIDTSADPRGLRRALRLTAPDGVCTSAGALHARTSVPTGLMFTRNMTLKVGRSHARGSLPDVLGLIASGKIEPEKINTHVGSIEDGPKALLEHACGTSIKTVLVE